MEAVLGILPLLLLGLIHFIPTIVAIQRKKGNRVSIIAINVFFGWTLIGWLIALYLACRKELGNKLTI
ncbi:superinfection immunity protein [Aquibacillus kalidii]|uniref:superinfection immunity protein n=1 Tax=Aquibacillus kalidii TaxID=2762597 RepID=UPI001647CC68|nr:superinfection immunity protein [Aquibacillus kalidii]